MLNDLCAELLRDRLRFVFSPDVASSGWLGSKHQLSNSLQSLPLHFSSVPFHSPSRNSFLFCSLQINSVLFILLQLSSFQFCSLQLNYLYWAGSQRAKTAVLLCFWVLVVVPKCTFIRYFGQQELTQPFTVHISSSPLSSSSSLSLSSGPVGSPSRGWNVTVYVWHKPAKPAHSFFILFLCLFLSLWPFQLYFFS